MKRRAEERKPREAREQRAKSHIDEKTSRQATGASSREKIQCAGKQYTMAEKNIDGHQRQRKTCGKHKQRQKKDAGKPARSAPGGGKKGI